MTNKELILKSEFLLKKNNIYNYFNDIKILVAFFNKINLEKLFTILNYEINFNLKKYLFYLKKYIKGMPIQYLLNYQYFMNNKFFVNKNVLIPRYETEEFVDYIDNFIIKKYFFLNNNNSNKKIILIDIGTGSGAISITLGLRNKKLNIFASDISKAALKIANFNIKSLKCKNVNLLYGNFLKPFFKKNIIADILVCNPPYISKKDKILLNKNVKNFEPKKALFSKNEGLFFYIKLFKFWKKIININYGFFCLEFGGNYQKFYLEKLLKIFFKNYKYKFLKDINNNWRMLFIYIF